MSTTKLESDNISNAFVFANSNLQATSLVGGSVIVTIFRKNEVRRHDSIFRC
jgi:hypothetical protein